MQESVPTGNVQAQHLGGTAPSFDVVSMFTQADIVVQIVMILLILASVYSWTVIFTTALRVNKAKAEANGFEEAFWDGGAIEELYESHKGRVDHPMAMVFVTAMREWHRSKAGRPDLPDSQSVQDRISRVMSVAINREMERLEGQVGYLATIGSAAPFIGLFGTVWGIMNSFQSIAMTANTSLAVVAPGIAEALLATALGLVAAIPAVIAYNKQAGDIGRFAARLEGFSQEFQAFLSRRLDERIA